MTPSEAHETALIREEGHDAMQLAVFRHLRSGAMAKRICNARFGYKDVRALECERMWLSAEMLYSGRFGVTFADIAMRYAVPQTDTDKDGKAVRHDDDLVDLILELKPRIISAAAVIRQVEMMRHKIRQFTPWRENRGYVSHAPEYRFSVVPVVPRDDPKLAELLELFDGQVAGWDGENLGWYRTDG